MIHYLLTLLLVCLIFICFLDASKWRGITLILIIVITSAIHFLFDDSVFVLAGVAMIVLPWSTLKEVPGRVPLYFTLLGVLLLGNGLHYAWVVTRDYGDEMDNFVRAILFLIVLIVSILVFNVIAVVLKLRQLKRNKE